MRRRIAYVLLCLTLLTASGCVRAAQEGPVYQVYYLLEEMSPDQALAPEARILPEGSDPVEWLLTCLLEGPEEEGLTPAIPSGVTLRGWAINDGLLTVDFSGRYGSLSGVGLTLADYSVVRTMTQLENIQAVEITADGEVLPYRDHQRLTVADTWLAEDTAEPAAEPS